MTAFVLSPEALEFMSNARALELTEAEALDVCKQAGIKPFWPVDVEAWLLASDRALNAAKSSGAYDAGRERFALHQELRSAL